VLVALGLAACGGSGSTSATNASVSPSQAIAYVSGSPVTVAEVNHWMATLAGTVYYEVSHSHIVPAGLVSDPPNYARCVSNLQAAIPKSGGAGTTSNELLTKCRELNVAFRIEAESYLIEAKTLVAFARGEGISANEQELQQLFKRVRSEDYPTAEDLRQYLADRRTSLADLMLHMRLNLLAQKATSKFTAEGKQPIAAYASAQRRLVAGTRCDPGYVVHGCGKFKGEELYPGGLSPAILMEQVTASVTGVCINKPACS